MVNDKTDASVMKKNFSSGGFIIFLERIQNLLKVIKLSNVSLSKLENLSFN